MHLLVEKLDAQLVNLAETSNVNGYDNEFVRELAINKFKKNVRVNRFKEIAAERKAEKLRKNKEIAAELIICENIRIVEKDIKKAAKELIIHTTGKKRKLLRQMPELKNREKESECKDVLLEKVLDKMGEKKDTTDEEENVRKQIKKRKNEIPKQSLHKALQQGKKLVKKDNAQKRNEYMFYSESMMPLLKGLLKKIIVFFLF